MAGRARGATGQVGKRNRGKQEASRKLKKGKGKQGEDIAARGRPRPCRTITGHNSGVWPTDNGAQLARMKVTTFLKQQSPGEGPIRSDALAVRP